MNAPDAQEHVILRDYEKKVTVVKDTKIENGAIFYFAKEDHTLGNAVRMSLLRDKDVRFAGYRMPHPLQFVCEVKVQTTSSDVRPIDVMITTLEALETEFTTLENRFRNALNIGHHQTLEPDMMQFQFIPEHPRMVLALSKLVELVDLMQTKIYLVRKAIEAQSK